MFLFLLSVVTEAVQKLPTVGSAPKGLAAILAGLMGLMAAGTLSKKTLRKYKRKLKWLALKEGFKSLFNNKQRDGEGLTKRQLTLIIIALVVFLILGLLVGWLAAFVVTLLLALGYVVFKLFIKEG
jgi:Flp pilus assembly protein TadB